MSSTHAVNFAPDVPSSGSDARHDKLSPRIPPAATTPATHHATPTQRGFAIRREEARTHLPLVLLITLFLALGLLYVLVTPIFEKPDEPQHFYVVRELAERGGLPVQIEGQPAGWGQEGSQPPLYYALAAALTFWTDTADWARADRTNPYAVQGDPLTFGNRNVYLHGPWEAFPWRGVTLAVQLTRLVSLLCGAASLVVTHALALSLFPARRDIAIGAALSQAVLPQFLFVAGAVSNDALATLTCGLALWQAVRVVNVSSMRLARSANHWRDDVLLGACVGLAALSKLSGAALAVVAVCAVVLAERDRLPRAVQRIVVVGVTAALVSGWWYARNLALYGDPTGLNRMLAIVGMRDPAPDIWQLLDETEGLRLSFWGLFGWFSILLPDILYRVYDLLALLALTGGVLAALTARTRGMRAVNHALWLPVLAAAFTFVGVLRWGTITPGLQGRLLFPALSAGAVLFSAGMHVLASRVRVRIALRVLAAGMTVIAALIPLTVIGPAYVEPEQPARVDVAPLLRWGDRISMMAVALRQGVVQPGGELDLAFAWQIDTPLDTDYTLYVKVFGEDDELIASADTFPGFGMLPTSQWSPARRVVDRYRLRVSLSARAPVLAQVVVGWYDRATGAALPPFTAQGLRVVRPVVARVKVLPLRAPPAPSTVHQADFGGAVRFHGYDLNSSGVTLYWSALQPLKADFVVFVHALDAAGRIVAQHDAQPRGGAFPTSVWDVGMMVPDHHALTFPPETTAVAFGMYDRNGGARLAVSQGDSAQITIPYLR